MIPPDPYSTADFLVVIGGTVVIAVVGSVSALRRRPGAWRPTFLVGICLPVVAGLLWWWGWSTTSADETGVLEGGPSLDEVDPYVRIAWTHFLVNLTGLAGLAVLVWAALRGREKQEKQEHPTIA